MLRSFFIVNLVLLAVVAYLGYNLFHVATADLKVPSIDEAVKEPAGKKPKKASPKPKKKSYDIIKNFNLFNPSRVSVTSKAEPTPQKPKPKNAPKVFGTIILGDMRAAIIEDPSTRKRKMYKLNESVGDYVLSEIHKEKVVLLWNGEKVEVKLREDKGITPKPVAQVQRTQQLQQQRKQQQRTLRRPRRPRRIRRNVPPPPTPEQLK